MFTTYLSLALYVLGLLTMAGYLDDSNHSILSSTEKIPKNVMTLLVFFWPITVIFALICFGIIWFKEPKEKDD